MQTTAIAGKPETTYNDAYRRRPSLPLKRYPQPPSIEHMIRGDKTLLARQYSRLHGQHGTKQTLGVKSSAAEILGIGNINYERFLGPKPIVRTHPPKDLFEYLQRSRPKSRKKERNYNFTKESLAKMSPDVRKDIVYTLANDYTYTPASQLAARGSSLPCTKEPPPGNTFEVNSDMVKYRPLLYEEEPAEWQIVGPDWDKVQVRPPINHSLGDDPAKLFHHGKKKYKNLLSLDVAKQIEKLAKENNLNTPFARPCPGYAGFVPRAPIETCSLAKPQPKETMRSCMIGSYRSFPEEEYSSRPRNFHKSPLSKCVTLTYPYNAFNKSQNPLEFTHYI